MSYQTLLYDSADAVATITLNRPDRLNTIVPPMPDELEAAVRRALDDENVKVIALRGAGRAFCAGFDFVKYQQRSIPSGNLAQAFQETWLRHAQADVHQNGFKNNRRDFSGMLLEAQLHAGKIVESGDNNVRKRRLGHAQPARN